jgi:hypothetical protein
LLMMLLMSNERGVGEREDDLHCWVFLSLSLAW